MLIHGELAEQDHPQRVGLVALDCFGQVDALNLPRTQRDKAGDLPSLCVAHNTRTRDTALLVLPSMTPEPLVKGISAAIEPLAVIITGKGTRRG